MAKKALITGITGQDGSYLAETLLNVILYLRSMVLKRQTLMNKHVIKYYCVFKVEEK
jgi:GDP-D-mannose dehydratase